MFESRRYRRKPVLTNAINVTIILMTSVNSVKCVLDLQIIITSILHFFENYCDVFNPVKS